MEAEDALRRELEHAFTRAPLRRSVVFHELTLPVGGNHEPALDWIDRYLGPWYEVHPSSAASETGVAVFVDAELHRRLLAVLEGLPGTEAQTHKWRPATRYAPGTETTAYVYREGRGITVSDRQTGRCAYVAAPGDESAMYEPVRIVRERFTTELQARGYVVLHAGAVELAGGALVLCGPRGAGKTTLICGLLEHTGANFVANDRIYVGPAAADGPPVVVSWPWSTRVGLGACRASAALRHWLVAGRSYDYPQLDWDHAGGIDAVEAAAVDAGTPVDSLEPGMKVELTGRELASALDSGIASAAPARCVVFPEIDLRSDSTRLEPVTAEWAAGRLLEELLSPEDEVYPDWLDLRRDTHDAVVRDAEAVIARLVSSGPLWRLSYHDVTAAARVLAEAAIPDVAIG
jgi:hypothetical protein